MPRLMRFLFFVVVAWSATLARGDILIGTKRQAVIEELGKPTSAARRGTHEILIYPKGVRIELEGDEVSDIKGYVPKGVDPAALAKANAVNAAPAPVPAAPNATAVAPAGAAPASPTASHPKTATPDHAEEVEPDDEREPPPSLGYAIGVAAAMLVAQFLLTFTALKIAFHYHQMDALWSGILAIAGIDVALQTLLAIFFYFHNDELHLGIAGTGLPGLVMIWSIRQFCLDQRWSRAFATTSAVKTASILLTLGLLALTSRFS